MKRTFKANPLLSPVPAVMVSLGKGKEENIITIGWTGIINSNPPMTYVETVVLLSHKKPDSQINVKVEFGEGEDKFPINKIADRAEKYKPKEKVTYKMIQAYIKDKFGLKMHTSYIAEVKRNMGIQMQTEVRTEENLKYRKPHPPGEKVEAIKKALLHFELI